jgi:hypothetical protein
MAKRAKGKAKKSTKVRDMSPKNPKGGLPAVQRSGGK